MLPVVDRCGVAYQFSLLHWISVFSCSLHILYILINSSSYLLRVSPFFLLYRYVVYLNISRTLLIVSCSLCLSVKHTTYNALDFRQLYLITLFIVSFHTRFYFATASERCRMLATVELSTFIVIGEICWSEVVNSVFTNNITVMLIDDSNIIISSYTVIIMKLCLQYHEINRNTLYSYHI